MFISLLPHLLKKRIVKNPPVLLMYNVLTWFIILGTIHTIGFKYIEQVSWGESAWLTWQTATTVGYGNRPAETFLGRWLAIITLTPALALLGVIFSTFMDINLSKIERRRIGLMNNPFKDGLIVINFPGKAVFSMLEMEYRSLDPDVGICVIDDTIEELPPTIAHLKSIHFVKGSLLSKNTYERAEVMKNKIVIVFPVDSGVSHSDATTRTVVGLISNFITDKTRIIHILVDPRNKHLFQDTRSVSVFETMEILGVVQECQDPGSAEIIQKLLLNTEGANPKTVIPKRIIGWTWIDFQIKALKTGNRIGVKINPFAIIKKDKEIYSCPPYDLVIEEGDALSIITYNNNGFNWEQFERELEK